MVYFTYSLSVVDPIKKKKQELRDERFSEFAPPSIYSSSSKSSSSELTSSPKRPRIDPNTQDSGHTTQQVDLSSASTPSTLGANQTANNANAAATGIPAPPYQYGGYFYPPGPYPPPFAVPPPPPMGMPFPPPPPPGGLYFAAPPPPGMGVAYQHQVAPPTTQSAPQVKPPPPPPGLPPD